MTKLYKLLKNNSAFVLIPISVAIIWYLHSIDVFKSYGHLILISLAVACFDNMAIYYLKNGKIDDDSPWGGSACVCTVLSVIMGIFLVIGGVIYGLDLAFDCKC